MHREWAGVPPCHLCFTGKWKGQTFKQDQANDAGNFRKP